MKKDYDEAIDYLESRAIETIRIEANYVDLEPRSQRNATLDYICLRDEMSDVAELGDMSLPWECFAYEALVWCTMKRLETEG